MTFAATERNLAIVEAYRNRPHIKAIGEQFSITGTRVLQIVVQYERATGDKLPRGNQSGPRNAEGEAAAKASAGKEIDMTILVHNGYQGSIEYEDGHIVIQLLHIDDFVSTSCDDAKAVEFAFHSLVDEYLETCNTLGKEPDKRRLCT